MIESMADCMGRLKKNKLFTIYMWKIVYSLEINSDTVPEKQTTI